MTRRWRPFAALLCALLAPAGPALAIDRDAFRQIRGRYEGMILRLRVDLKGAATAMPPNTVSREGIGYAREAAPAIFGRLERVYLERVVNQGKTRLELTVYRSQEEARRLRASAIPQPMGANPLAGSTLAAFAQLGSTSVLLQIEAGKNDPPKQMEEAESLLDRLFYLKSEPTTDELERFVKEHRGLPVARLVEITGLRPDRIRALLEESRALPP